MNMRDQISPEFIYLNIGHFLDHMIMLIFAKAAFSIGIGFGLSNEVAFAEMISYGIPSLVLFGGCAPVSAYLADKWNRKGMLTVFFIGIGLASILTGFSQSIIQVGFGLALIGIFASIYHPVGISLVIEDSVKVGWRLGVNGVWGNMGVAGAPLLTGFILGIFDWRMAFIIPGIFSIFVGLGFFVSVSSRSSDFSEKNKVVKELIVFATGWKRALIALSFITTAGGFVFGAMTFLLPRLFDVRMFGITEDLAVTGSLAAVIYAAAAFAQLFVGKAIDNHKIKSILIFIAVGQILFISIMAIQKDYILFLCSLLAMGFVFGQIPISDAILSKYVPDQWRTKILSIKFLVNLVVGATALFMARFFLSKGDGFEQVLIVLSIAAVLVLGGAILLPKR